MGLGKRCLHSGLFDGDEANPMESMANLADVMLVLACGLMLALMLRWNVSVSPETEVTMGDDVSEVGDLQEALRDAEGDGSSYVRKGTVYEDPDTGKYYLVEDAEGSSDVVGMMGEGSQSDAAGGDR